MNIFDNIIEDALNIETEQNNREISRLDDTEIIQALATRHIQIHLRHETSSKSLISEFIKNNALDTIQRYMNMCGVLSSEGFCNVSITITNTKPRISWTSAIQMPVVDIYYKGIFCVNSRQAVYMLHDLMKLIFDTTGYPCSSFTMNAKDNEGKFRLITSSPEISPSFFDVYTSLIKIIDGGNYFSALLKLSDATDCIYYMTARMLAHEKRLSYSTLNWLVKRTRNVIKRSPLNSALSADITFQLISKEHIKKEAAPIKNLSFLTKCPPAVPLTKRMMYICPIMRKKRNIRTVLMNNSYEEMKHIVPSADLTIVPDSFYFDILKENIENGTAEMIANTEVRYHNHISHTYNFTPVFHDNEAYWVVIKEDRLLTEEEKFMEFRKHSPYLLPLPSIDQLLRQ